MNYKELKQLIQKHNKAYYDNSASMITDAEYDQLYDKLESIEKAQGWRDHDSPTKHVGGVAVKFLIHINYTLCVKFTTQKRLIVL